MARLKIVGGKGNKKKLRHLSRQLVKDDKWYCPDGTPLDSRHEIISLLIPESVKAFYKDLEKEIEELCGKWHCRDGEHYRWSSQPGSIVLGHQKVAIEKPRVRRKTGDREASLSTYERFQDPRLFDEKVFCEGLKHVSQRDYEKGLPKIGSSFGVSKSSINRRWIKATAKKVDELLSRDISFMDILAVFIDGKRFQEYGVVVALGVSTTGKKYVLGVYQAKTEHHKPCLSLLNNLSERGLPEEGLLFIVDGGGGLNKALNIKYDTDSPEKRKAVRIRCHFHKWSNLDKDLDEKDIPEASRFFWGMRDARNYSEAKAFADCLENHLKKANLSALHSFQEAKDDLLVIHQLNLNADLRKFFSTTNPIESLNSLLQEDMRRVKKWKDSEHFQRWLCTVCLSNEKRMRKIRGFRGLNLLKESIKILCHLTESDDLEMAAG
jgi:transposase-like protein